MASVGRFSSRIWPPPAVLVGLVAFAAAALFTTLPAHAVTARVDDIGTIVNQAVVPMRWRQLVPGRGADNSVEASVRVALRLNMTRWLMQPVRLYMALGPAVGEPIHANWRTQGRLMGGALRSGGRVLVFEGIPSAASMEETIDLTLVTDGRTLTSQQALQFYFEVETP